MMVDDDASLLRGIDERISQLADDAVELGTVFGQLDTNASATHQPALGDD
jgi:hypothetical protein